MKMPVSDDCHAEVIDYRQRYRSLKRKFRCVIFENESFQDELKKAQRKLLKLSQDKSFLLDRLLQYERIEDSSSDSDVTISSDSDLENFAMKKKKMPATVSTGATSATSTLHTFSGIGAHSSTVRNPATEPAPKRKKVAGKVAKPLTPKPAEAKDPIPLSQGDGHMTSEEIERHLESRQILIDLLPERAPPTVPTEMFSNDPSSLESEFNDAGAETSPSNIGDGFTEDDSLIIDLPDQDGCM